MHIESYAFNMQSKYVSRALLASIQSDLKLFPVVAVLGPRQCGKSTLAKALIQDYSEKSLYLDLERPSDVQKLHDPELFFDLHQDTLICLDEIQRIPDLFNVLRSVVDQRGRNGQFLILGSASRDLLRQSSETLAGRIAYLELTPFTVKEVLQVQPDIFTCLVRGGFPDSLLADNDHDSLRWRRNFIRTYLERDIPQLGIQIPAASLERLWKMCAHHHGQLLNQSQFGQALGVSHTTVRTYIDLLSQTFMLRVLPPLQSNLKKRLVKSPRIYIRDTGILHALLELETIDDIIGHPVFGAAWESMVIENVLAAFPDWRGYFYRSASGSEISRDSARGVWRRPDGAEVLLVYRIRLERRDAGPERLAPGSGHIPTRRGHCHRPQRFLRQRGAAL